MGQLFLWMTPSYIGQLLLNHGSEGYGYGAGFVQRQRHSLGQERPGFLGGLLGLEQLVFQVSGLFPS